MAQTDYSRSPCFGCTRVKDPEKCESKRCIPWREWFLSSWEKCRSYPWEEMLQKRATKLREDPCLRGTDPGSSPVESRGACAE